MENKELQPWELKVSSKSQVNSLAGAIAKVYKQYGKAELITIGAGALNQATKAVARARGFTASSGHNLGIIPVYSQVVIEEEERTTLRLQVVDVKYI
ncbi:stage V sporulation protein S [Bacillus cereus]|uniref:Stage V sporulation protein SpoVS n=1 Tax=Bacillus cereus TaxID=1396 RepID=A0A161R7B6_BACCE|nr:stage V sporulation protein S [Bacillus cereus]KZD72151.1 Stage V sporulation protein SpoVS [Bacillus cereus]HDR8322891.1 stage V sporulation protein S [Bacillus cereus]HDR8331199.1 stage V sporulation protein S [Bacillus cereus]HDR8332937.1 stage V sporulation protein S [Bacillus cereus]